VKAPRAEAATQASRVATRAEEEEEEDDEDDDD
jgi:hypothetical protein